jgi:hypothetical protein
MERLLGMAPRLGLSPAFVTEFMDAVHRESIRRQGGTTEEQPSGSPPFAERGTGA